MYTSVAYSLLRSSIQDNNPVIFFEHRWLYDIEGRVDDEQKVSIGDTGVHFLNDPAVTIIATSWMVVEALQAQRVLADHSINSIVIDAYSITPLDIETITCYASFTGRVIIADNDWTNCGFSAEISALITENCFHSLLEPPIRIGFAPVPCPTTRPLENLFYPSAKDIIKAAEDLLHIGHIDLSEEHINTYEDRFKGPF